MTAQTTSRPADTSGTFALGGDLPINRLGYGAMQFTVGRRTRTASAGSLGSPQTPGASTSSTLADSYGPFVSESLIRLALHPYADDIVIATKGGQTHSGPDDWRPVGRPEYLRQQLHLSLRHLGLEQIDLYQLHRIDPRVPLADQLGALVELQRSRPARLGSTRGADRSCVLPARPGGCACARP
jgi:aryl-alcohol dehydrogenase-like predicted oxidoreductase